MQRKFWGIISVDIDAASQLLIIYSAFVIYLRKLEHSEAVHHLFIDYKKAYHSFSGEFLYRVIEKDGRDLKPL